MTTPLLVDTGPLVALLSERDRHHEKWRGAVYRTEADRTDIFSIIKGDTRTPNPSTYRSDHSDRFDRISPTGR